VSLDAAISLGVRWGPLRAVYWVDLTVDTWGVNLVVMKVVQMADQMAAWRENSRAENWVHLKADETAALKDCQMVDWMAAEWASQSAPLWVQW
jgi:hypothetical protein